MKKFLGIILAVVMLATVAFAADITVTLNGEAVDCESYGSPATIVEGRTLVPLRAIFEALGATVEWDPATKSVSSTLGDDSISLAVGSTTLVKNGEDVTLDVPAQIINSRTMVPARAIAEAYGVDVQWDAASRTVILTKEEKVEEVVEEKKDDNVLFVLTGENFTGNEGYTFTGGVSIVPEVVADFEDENNKVLFLHTDYTEKQSWTYFRNNVVNLEAGKRYLISYRVSVEKDAADSDIAVGSIGLCLRYGDTNCETHADNTNGTSKDHGVYQIKNVPGTWTQVNYIFTIPETFVASETNGVGIFANPMNNLPVCYYLDDVTMSVYEGPAEDGPQTAESLKAAENMAAFNIDNAKGVAFDFDDSYDLKVVSASEKAVADGNIVMSGVDGFVDLIVGFNDLAYAADKYSAIAVRFKADLKGVSSHPKASAVQIYFTTDAEPNLSEGKSTTVQHSACIQDGEWLVAYVPVATNESWKGTVTSFRIDPANDEGTVIIDKVVLVEA